MTLLLLTAGGIGALVGLGLFCWAVHRMDDIWHRRRAWAPRMFLMSAILLAVSVAAIFYGLV